MFFGARWSRRLLSATACALALALGYGCGGKSEVIDGSGASGGNAGSAPDAGSAGNGGLGNTGATDSGSDAADATSDGPDVEPDSGVDAGDAGPDAYVDPGCPDAQAPPGIVECSLFAEPSGCAPGEGCYPYVEHPFGEGCEAQTFGAVCVPAGTGTQGAECGTDSAGCAPGHICVIGTKAGKRCVQMCDLTQPNSCESGLICGETDVEGVGVCG